MPELLSRSQVAALIGHKPRHVPRWTRARGIAGVWVSGQAFYALDLDEEQCNIPIANFDEIVWLRWLDDPEHGWHFTTPGGERCAAICAPDTPPAEAARILVNYV